MTETICPTCGARCIENEMWGECDSNQQLIAINPDLTRLREIMKEHGDHAGPHMRNMAYPLIVQAVKELLGENKP